MFLAVTFHEKLNRRQRGPTRSMRMRLPTLGALGCMSAAGLSRSEDRQLASVAARVQPTPSANAQRAGAISTGSGKGRSGTG